MEPYSSEFRGEVLAACDANEGTHAIAVRFKVSDSWVRRIKQQRREMGQVAPKKAAPRKPTACNFVNTTCRIRRFVSFVCSRSGKATFSKTFKSVSRAPFWKSMPKRFRIS